MKRFFTSTAAALTLSAAFAQASIVMLGSSPQGNYVTDAAGVPLANGSLVLVGTFADEAALSGMSALPVSQMMALGGWSTFGSSVITSVFDNPGKVSGDVENDTAEAAAFGGKQIFIWIFNGATIDDSQLSGEYGIFTARNGTPAWLFPSEGLSPQVQISFDDPMLVALVGSINGNQLSLATIVPEPAAYAALLGVAGLAVVGLRRRMKQRVAV